jgi:hypothetical protein
MTRAVAVPSAKLILPVGNNRKGENPPALRFLGGVGREL